MERLLDRIGEERAVLLAGPTASGKSTAALRLAEAAGRAGRMPVIVNADAMQVYRPLRILTARPGPVEEGRAPHRLYGHVAGGTRYSVGAWLADIALVLGDCAASGALPVIVGGTGLYFKALTEGLTAAPAVPASIEAKWERRLVEGGPAALHRALMERDPAAAASIRPSDPQRLMRALGVHEATGASLSRWRQASPSAPLLPEGAAARIVVDADRAALCRRIDDRVDRMVTDGALAEVEALLAEGLDGALPVMKAIGVRDFAAVLRGETPLSAAVARVKTETRRYAKRQTTWLRHQMAGWQRMEA